jgi:hypothetical protein
MMASSSSSHPELSEFAITRGSQVLVLGRAGSGKTVTSMRLVRALALQMRDSLSAFVLTTAATAAADDPPLDVVPRVYVHAGFSEQVLIDVLEMQEDRITRHGDDGAGDMACVVELELEDMASARNSRALGTLLRMGRHINMTTVVSAVTIRDISPRHRVAFDSVVVCACTSREERRLLYLQFVPSTTCTFDAFADLLDAATSGYGSLVIRTHTTTSRLCQMRGTPGGAAAALLRRPFALGSATYREQTYDALYSASDSPLVRRSNAEEALVRALNNSFTPPPPPHGPESASAIRNVCRRSDVAAQFHRACAHGVTRDVCMLLSSLVPCTYGRNTLEFAMRAAAAHGHADVVDLLLLHNDAELDPSVGNQCALRTATANGHTRVVARLLADARTYPWINDHEPLRSAAERGHADVVALLLADARTDPTAVDARALLSAARGGHTRVVDLLLLSDAADVVFAATASAGRSVYTYAQVYAALGAAARAGHVDTVLRLFDDTSSRADPTRADHAQIRTALACDGAVDAVLRHARVPMTNDVLALVGDASRVSIDTVSALVARRYRAPPPPPLRTLVVRRTREIRLVVDAISHHHHHHSRRRHHRHGRPMSTLVCRDVARALVCPFVAGVHADDL